MAGRNHHDPGSINDVGDLLDVMVSSLKSLIPAVAPTASGTFKLASPLTKFHLFPKLPVELQLRIWGFCAPPARILVVKSKHMVRRRKKQKMNWYSRPVPIVLQICQQSRHEYLHRDGVYKDHPTYKLCRRLLNGNRLWPVYISMEQDIVQVQHTSVLRTPDFIYLQHLLFHHWTSYADNTSLFYGGYFNFHQFVDLKRVIYGRRTPDRYSSIFNSLLGLGVSQQQHQQQQQQQDEVDDREDFPTMLKKKLKEVNKSELFAATRATPRGVYNFIHDYPVEAGCLVDGYLDRK